MANDSTSERDSTRASGALFAAALGAASGSTKVDALIERQIAIADLQIEDMKREDAIRHWSLRVHHISDVLKLGLELALAVIVIAFAALICTAVWSAASDRSLVIEAFSVPPDLMARGITGQAVAAQLQDKLTAMQAATDSARPADSYANNWSNDIKVQIPDTGISVTDFYRLLVSWFGHQTHITGEVYRTAGGIAITARSSGETGGSVSGNEGDLDGLIQKTAEGIFARTQPYRYAIYLMGQSPGTPQAVAILDRLSASGSLRDRVWAYTARESGAEFYDPLHAADIQREGIPLAPDFALAYENVMTVEEKLGRPEVALAYGRKSASLLGKDDGEMSERAYNITLVATRASVDDLVGDFEDALRENTQASLLPEYAHIASSSRMFVAIDLADMHDNQAARRTLGNLPAVSNLVGQVMTGLSDIVCLHDMGDWQGVLAQQADLTARIAELVHQPPFTPAFETVTLSRQVWPYAAEALAHQGDMNDARALAAKTPTDCYVCLRARGNVEALAGDWKAAAVWYARATAMAPSIPFAFADWGRMLLAKGDLDGAIAKFAIANQKGTRFADPLELWGEALIAKNRSDLAAAKFEEAAKDAPNWGRLHLEWGEALWWSGDKDGARKEFETASHLELSPSERAELARVRPSP